MNLVDTSTLLETSSLSPFEKDSVYNGLDCCVTLEVAEVLLSQIDPVARRTYEFSHALQGPILEMMMRGVRVDEEQRQRTLREFQSTINLFDDNLSEVVRGGIGFTNAAGRNPLKQKAPRWWRSPAQLKNLFFDVMGLPHQRQRSNSSGEYELSVNRVALEKLQEYLIAEPLVLHILALRDLDKKRSWLETGIDRDGRMRTNLNIAGTDTGRLASSDSDFGSGGNMQNIDRSLRQVFVADEGMKFGNIDLEQGDARNVGAICWNLFVEEMGEAFAGSYLNACESGDLHTYNSRLIWPGKAWTGDLKADKKIAEVIFYRQDSFRQMSKKGGHATNFWGLPPTIAKHLHVPTALIEQFQQAYFHAYPVIGTYDKRDRTSPNWHNHVIRSLSESHSLTTLLGRRRFFWGREDDASTIRRAIAYEPQSLTADEIDNALLNLWRPNHVQLLMQVHDSILFQYPEDREDEIIPWAIETARTLIPLNRGRDFVVPTEAKVGWNWGDVEYNDRGEVIGNPEGIAKWKGHDPRKRASKPWLKTFSIFNH